MRRFRVLSILLLTLGVTAGCRRETYWGGAKDGLRVHLDVTMEVTNQHMEWAVGGGRGQTVEKSR